MTIALGAAALWLAGVTPAGAQSDGARPRVSVTPGGGYARVLFEWPGEARASAQIAGDVIIVRFDAPVQVDAAAIARQLDGVAAAARMDADGRSLRIALRTPVRIATSSAGRRFALDIMPADRRADPPPIQDPQADQLREAKTVTVRATEMETSTRLTFELLEKTPYEASLKDGVLTVRFQRPGIADVSRLNAKPPTWIASAASQSDAQSLTFRFQVDPAIRLSDRAEGSRVIVDLGEPVQDAPPAIAAAPAAPVAGAPVTADAGPVNALLQSANAPAPVTPAPINTAVGAPKSLVRTDAGAVAAGVPAAQVPAPLASASVSPGAAVADLRPAQAATEKNPDLRPGALTSVMDGQDVRIAATFQSLPRAAVFRRGPAVWMVFETTETLDPSALTALAGTGVSLWSAPQTLQPGVLGLRLRASGSTPVSVQIAGEAWIVTIGPSAAPEAGGVTFLREAQGPSLARLRAIVPGAGGTVWVKDPAMGDRLAVTPAGAPLRGVIEARRFPEFEILPSLQGLAVRAAADDLQVTADAGAVAIWRPRGLAMSRETGRPEDFAGPVPDTQYPHAELEAWKRQGDDPASAARTLLRASADTPGGMSQQRMALARYYVASDLGAEALGVLRLVVAQDATSDATPALRTVRAIANLQMRRYADAIEDLSAGAFARDPHAAFWRGLAFAGIGKMAEARSNLLAAGKFFGAYPAPWQARARLALANASLALGDVKEAERAIAIIPPGLPKDLAAAYLLARGRVQEALAKDDSALSLYAEAMGSGHPETAVRAELQALLLKARGKKITPEQAADQLERLRYKWRGDEIEMATLRALGEQYVAMGRVREGLDALQTAVRHFPSADMARDINMDMQKVFASAFLGTKTDALPPVQALALFYDFKQFTPPGLEGDEIIRKLTERLVEVDLLPQAAELLQHQVDNRLDGVARAQVATRLAVIYLLDRKPEKALNAIRTSRQARLPDAMIAERRLLEARALTDLNLTDEAIETLADDVTPAASRLRADIFWAGQRWAAAAQASEALAGEAWSSPMALSDTARHDVLRAAVAFVLANDRAGVERLRVRFGPKMADSKDARSFAVVVGETNPTSPDMRAMVRQVASADSLDAFLNELKSRKDSSIN
jgi:tetratricopeptide (TPR) repeat protein